MKLQRKDGITHVEGVSAEGKRFLDMQYSGEVEVEDSCLETFLEYVRKIGLTCKLLML